MRREERKVVSVLFCDLAGFTASADSADPEDVSRELGAYHAAVRGEIERFGGTVEKFIGDAAVGVWGAPVGHEDDAERAVRCALAIAGAAGIDVRVAVNTGEALVKLAPEVDMGEGLVGDVVNTASRLQSVAPVGRVVVGEGTMRAAAGSIEWEALAPVALKGKSQPVAVWRAVAARPAGSGRRETSTTPFVGRRTELELLRGLYERALAEPGLQQVTIVGESGVGKSRLVAEFAGWIDAHAATSVVRRGRCLAYGDGIGFWPLAEVVKAQLPASQRQMTEDDARTKLGLGVERMTDAPWLRTRLAPLVGLAGEAGEREEVFTAWQRFLDEIAERAPLVLVIEDIHWADPAMLAFMRHLAEWSSGVPMLLVCTTRPELLEAHAGWGGDLVNATTVAVRPLNDEDTSTLAHALLTRSVDASDAAATLAARCGGNPLYAEEFARLLTDRTGASSDMAMPDTVQALIAARIDTLPLERKALLHDAAVIGKAFWAGGLAAIGDRDAGDVRTHLHELARKELIRRVRISTVPGDEEYVFWHDLVHDVAYQQIPRARRAVLHRRTAEWIEQVSEERIRDRTELLAYHYLEALTLTRAIGEPYDELLRHSAVRQLAGAGKQAMAVDWDHAGRLLRDGLDLSLPGDAERTQLLCGLAEFEINAGRHEAALPLIHEAEATAEAAGDLAGLSEALNQRLWVGQLSGDRLSLDEAITDSVQRLEGAASAESAKLLVSAALFTLNGDDDRDKARVLANRGLEVAEAVGDKVSAGLAIQIRGLIRATDGDRGGLEDLQSSLALLLDLGSTWTPMGMYHLAESTLLWDGPGAAAGLFTDAIKHSARIGIPAHMRCGARGPRTPGGSPTRVPGTNCHEADRVLAWAANHDSPQYALVVSPSKARVLALRGDTTRARETMAGIIDQARRSRDPQVLAPTLATSAMIEHIDRNPDTAAQLLTELGAAAGYCLAPTSEICRLLIILGALRDARTIVEGITRGPPRLLNAVPSVRAMLAEADGSHQAAADDYDAAAIRWRNFGNPLELAHALAGRARCLNALGQTDHAQRPGDEGI